MENVRLYLGIKPIPVKKLIGDLMECWLVLIKLLEGVFMKEISVCEMSRVFGGEICWCRTDNVPNGIITKIPGIKNALDCKHACADAGNLVFCYHTEPRAWTHT